MKDADNLTNIIKILIRRIQNEWPNWSNDPSSKAEEVGAGRVECEGTKRDFKELYRERRI